MQNNITLLNLESLTKYLYPESKQFILQILDSTDSTNSFLINLLKNKQISDSTDFIYVVAAELQTKGRGRNGHSWRSGFGESLTFSLSWRFKKYPASQLSSLSLIIGIAIIRVLRHFSIEGVSLKWPNDVLVNRSKIAGVLIELRSGIRNSYQTVIGIGINFNLSENTRNCIDCNVTDLFEVTGKLLDRNLILSALLVEIKKTISHFEMFGFSYFKNEWISYHAFEGKHVCLNMPNNQIVQGIVDGVNDNGAICLLTDSGRKMFDVGEISLRDIN
ncbi:BirA family transcriptional regulator, biotin operon repressor / biotin-[acetyl-CoA-carboxylase] ligase [Nitrosomonas sp. PY1]|uniref:biotin--[acetyl-CoA-carboxylase] ligase n=1 Tax=Nitrosomonas sp. PY1 TaxID=1803906 RepID=UPI001FC858F0|nr:biotin--[acetyl-CoA-carboxylase] ligase [Nitrosomonas sp. PY1]GKS68830.1 BirA family transcriptional regulator, biotin operon repressor / biotin-[acetyl-CoA-carboxylase] ligase [Nitrosomonas sp. PY1]